MVIVDVLANVHQRSRTNKLCDLCVCVCDLCVCVGVWCVGGAGTYVHWWPSGTRCPHRWLHGEPPPHRAPHSAGLLTS